MRHSRNQIKNNLEIQGFRNSLIPKFLNYETLILKYIFYKRIPKACPHVNGEKTILWCNSIGDLQDKLTRTTVDCHKVTLGPTGLPSSLIHLSTINTEAFD